MRGGGRILGQQVRAKAWTVRQVHVGSWTHRSDGYPGHKHWDLAITYRVKARVPAQHGPWWAELGWRAPREVRAKAFAWNDDCAREVGVARFSPPRPTAGAAARSRRPPR